MACKSIVDRRLWLTCEAIIFDPDGTSINTPAALCDAMNFAFKAVCQDVDLAVEFSLWPRERIY